MAVFQGFSFKLPVYSVILPQTGISFDVQSLTVAQVNRLKGSLTTPSRAHILLNDLIWDVIVNKQQGLTKDKFKKSVTTLDREALLYGIYHTTFGDDRQFNVICVGCAEEQLINIKLDSIFEMEAYPYSESMQKSYITARAVGEADEDPEIEDGIQVKKKKGRQKKPQGMPDGMAKAEGLDVSAEDKDDGIVVGSKLDEKKETKTIPNPKVESDEPKEELDILKRRISITLPISKVVAIIRQPTIYDEEDLLSSLSFSTKKQNELVGETMIIDRFEEYKKGDKVATNIITNREDILWGYESLPPRDKTKMFDEYNEKFGKYSIKLNTGFECRKCGYENDLDLNISVQFFRLVRVA